MSVKQTLAPAEFQRKLQAEPFKRSLLLEESIVVDEATRTVQLAWASEYAEGERWYGKEILDCSASSIRLGRLADGASVLFNHDEDVLLGVVEGVDIGSDRVCRAKVRFDTCAEAEIRYQQVLNKTLKYVSVKYRVHKMVLEKQEDDNDTYRVVDWEPYEISMVTIPFDHTVGIGRSADADLTAPATILPQPKGKIIMEPEVKPGDDATRTAELNNALSKLTTADIDITRRDAIVETGVKYAD